MFKNKFIKLTVSSLLILLAIWIATPKVYIHELLQHNHSEILAGNETKVKSQSADDCDFENYNKPVYFNLFKFIYSFIPHHSSPSNKISQLNILVDKISYAIPLLRAPPVK